MNGTLFAVLLAAAATGLSVSSGRRPKAVRASAARGGLWLPDWLDRRTPFTRRASRAHSRAVARELPHLVALMVGPLRGGASPAAALTLCVAALPGPAADRFRESLAALDVGADPEGVWRALGSDIEVGDLGRALVRAQRSGACVVETVERLADELALRAAAEAEDRAHTVGVRAAVPLGLCLLPAFLLLGVVPLVAGLFTQVLT